MAPGRPEPGRILQAARAQAEDVRSLDVDLIGFEEAYKHAGEMRELRRKEKGRKRKDPPRPTHRFGARTDTRSRVIQAFWAMHVEALNWNGMGTGEYASALPLSR